MPFYGGGELFVHWQNQKPSNSANPFFAKKRFDEHTSKIFGAQVLLGLEAMHKRNVVYRDLKPENIVMDKEGNLAITDFGLSK